MNQESNRTDGKRVYEPPQITKISLRPEEAVLGHCKISGTSGPGHAGGCFPFCGSSVGS
jgi:hypothetical protein